MLDMIKEVDAASVSNEKTEMLVELKGIGPAIATVLTRELFYRASASSSYVGLTPAPYDSGDTRRRRAGHSCQCFAQDAFAVGVAALSRLGTRG